MNRNHLTLILLLCSSMPSFSQKEVFFNTTKPEDIKVESMQGVEIGSSINTHSLFQPSYSNDKSFNIPLNMGYFNEKRIAPTWTLTTRIELNQDFSNTAHSVYGIDSLNYHDSVTHYTFIKINNYKLEYRLGVSVGIEPRWYFGYKKRYQTGKANLNSGWFLSLPVSVGATLINTYKPDVIYDTMLIFKNYCSFGLSGMLGYRQSISKQLFLEGNFQLLNVSSGIYTLNKKFNITHPYIYIFPGIGLKAAYTFK